MNKNTIEYLAYLLDKAHKEEGREKAIVFLGAGTSVSAGIPLTGTIVRHIKLKFFNNPIVKECIKTKKDDYYSLMGALTADERRDLFHFYVTRKKVKLNISNIYLAQLLKLGYVDYIMTVNFDDLILKACTLYNFLPPVYDISNIKTITTTDIRKNSVIYLHGQYFGQWLLNNPDELKKVEDEVLSLFNAIKTRRTWIIVGYSGSDGIFEKIKSLGSFSNELFWVKHKFTEADKNVSDFIDMPNINAHRIEGYYADAFFLKLHAELSKLNKSLEAPDIIYKPFTYIKSIMQSINEVNEEDELNSNVKSMINVCNERLDKVIKEYEDDNTIGVLKQRIVDAAIKKEFNDNLASNFENEIAKNGYFEANAQLSKYYNSWGVFLHDYGEQNQDKKSFQKSVEKYKKAIDLNSTDSILYFNLGTVLYLLGKHTDDEAFYKECFKEFQNSIKINPKKYDAYVNWGNALLDFGNQKKDEKLFLEGFDKYETAADLNKTYYGTFLNWGIGLSRLAKNKGDKTLYLQSFQKFEKASILSSNNDLVYSNWSTALLEALKLEDFKDLDISHVKQICEKHYLTSGNAYNLSCVYAVCKQKAEALHYLKLSLEAKKITISHIEKDKDWNNYRDDEDFINVLKEYT